MSGTPSSAGAGPSPPIGAPTDANALVLATPSSTGGTCPCTREAHDGTATAARTGGFLRVAFTRAGRSPPDRWVRDATEGDADVRVVDATPCPTAGDDRGVVTVAAAGPSNLTDLGVRITDVLDDMDAAASRAEGGAGPVCCLGSLTALLQYVDTRRAYRFVNAVMTRVATHGGTTHAHIVPAVHDRQAVDTMASLFDLVAEPSADGDGLDVVRSRYR
ncbi:DUF7504 family protein [Halobaculum lipolyticum]|uniref:DUF7504 family protein n=1 Tax=Halobaculum lipolyticum TaxID=3032001 RepID=UPI0024C3302E|nr:hypothetical protein [Halobaculum sp. DT31]